jgi:3-phytase
MTKRIWALALLLAHCGDGTVTAKVETDPLPDGGEADDPAIWVNPVDPSKSVIIGTDKGLGGLGVYGLDGKQIQYLPSGRMNNVDLRGIVVTSGDRDAHALKVYLLDPSTRTLAFKYAIPVAYEPYGSCMYQNKNGKLYAFVDNKAGLVEQFELRTNGAVSVRTFDVGTQVEACVVDDELGRLYVGEEAVGVWQYGADPETGSERTLVDDVNGHLVADVEGLAIYKGKGGEGYLLVSSQGSSEYMVYTRRSGEYVGKFKIEAGAIDEVTESDGIEVASASLPARPLRHARRREHRREPELQARRLGGHRGRDPTVSFRP